MREQPTDGNTCEKLEVILISSLFLSNKRSSLVSAYFEYFALQNYAQRQGYQSFHPAEEISTYHVPYSPVQGS